MDVPVTKGKLVCAKKSTDQAKGPSSFELHAVDFFYKDSIHVNAKVLSEAFVI